MGVELISDMVLPSTNTCARDDNLPVAVCNIRTFSKSTGPDWAFDHMLKRHVAAKSKKFFDKICSMLYKFWGKGKGIWF
jgi:hypothetical protein